MLLVSYIQQYLNTSITVLTNQVWKLLIALFKVPNTGAFTVLCIYQYFHCISAGADPGIFGWGHYQALTSTKKKKKKKSHQFLMGDHNHLQTKKKKKMKNEK